MEALVHHLRKLGFTDLEAKCIILLSENGPTNGYEVAKRTGASRSNVYAALERLYEEGFVTKVKGDKTLYASISADEIVGRIEQDTMESLQYVEQLLPKQLDKSPDFYSLEGDRHIMARVSAEIRQAREEIVIDLWQEELEWLFEELHLAEREGKRVLVLCTGTDPVPLQRVIYTDSDAGFGTVTASSRRIAAVFDRRTALLGSRGKGMEPKAIVSEHPALVELILSHTYYKMIDDQLREDMMDQLWERYGERYSSIYRKYME